jgi:Domain of unknown function (DUF4832)
MFQRWLIIALTVVPGSQICRADDVLRRSLEYAPAAVDNPLKGLVPYAGDWKGRFPHSLEYGYLPLSALVTAPAQYDWARLEKLLDTCSGRGHQVIFRIYLEYPGKKDGIPPFLIKGGLKVHRYTDPSATPRVENLTPDYGDRKLRDLLKEFIAAFGKKYDGDPRIGYITAGLLGHWGEWHTYPREQLFASKEVQTEVLDAYQTAFRVTPVVLRYPSGPSDGSRAPNASRPFGYHDDSFAWATLDTGRRGDAWFYMAALNAAGPDALNKWKSQPIGGEIRPEAWGRVFDERPGMKQIQDFRRCVQETHASWLLDSGMFNRNQSLDRRKRAEDEVRRMGYEFYVSAVEIDEVADGKLRVVLELENRGVAPFYYEWPAEFGLIVGGTVTKTWRGTGKLAGLLPGSGARKWVDTLDAHDVARGKGLLAVRVPNALPTGNPVRFANKSQDEDLSGWLTLGKYPSPSAPTKVGH